MAGFSISNLQARLPVSNQFTQADQSRQLLTEYKAHLTTKNGVKSGVMYIGTRNGDNRIYRDHALNFRSRKGEAFQQMSAQIKDHFKQAYEGKVPPKQFEQLMQQVDAYLTQRSGGMGTKSFVRMVDAFERGVKEQAQLEAAGGRTLDGAVAQLIQGKDLPQAQAAAPDGQVRNRMQIKLDNMASGLRRIVGEHSQADVQTLGKGAVAQAFLARQAGQDSVFTLPMTGGAPEIPRNDWRHGEMAAATAQAKLDHVAQPQSFVLLVSRDMTEQLSHTTSGAKSVTLQGQEAAFSDLQAYEVPAKSLEQFMQSLPDGAKVEQAAVRMPLASGQNIHELTKSAPLTTPQFHQLQAGLYMALDEMHAAGLVHRDIKPANVMMDGDGRVKAVDLGSTEGVDRQGKAPASLKGYTESYVRPDLLWDNLSGDRPLKREVAADAGNDRYACAMTLMTGLAPGLDVANGDGRMALKAFQASQNVPPGSSFGAKFIDEIVAGALEFANTPPKEGLDDDSRQKSANQKAQLKAGVEQFSERLRAEPELRQSLEQMFNASLPGEAGNAAWEGLRTGSMATASLPESERKALNQLEIDRAVDRHLAANPDIQPGEAQRLRELAGKNIAGDNTLSAEDAGLVVAQSAQVAEQQRLGAQELILGGQPGSLQPGDPVYQSRVNVLRNAGDADYDNFGASFVDSEPQVGVSETDSNAQASVQASGDKGRVAQPPAPGLASESVEMGQAGDPRIEEEEDAPLMGQPVQAESAQAKGPVASATTPLTKAAKLSVNFDGPQPPKKAFTSLDAEPYQALGQAINAELAERGLKAAPGMARIEVNQKPVYCFFDSTGQARAILPKGQPKASGPATIKDLGDFSALKESFYRSSVLGAKKFSGSKTELSDLSWLTRAVPKELFNFLTNQGLDVWDFLTPLDEGGRVLVQFKVHGDPWMAELTLRAGAYVDDIDVDRPETAPLSINAFPLDHLLPEGETAIEALAEKVPHAQLLKNARVTYAPEYPWVRTTVTGDYVKKFKQAGERSQKLPFFENLVNHDHGGTGGSPGIINRMLVGVPTADYKKTISPPAASKLMSDATLRSERLDEFKSAALTAVDDLFIVTKEGFSPPESKRDHYLFNPKGKKLEIKMIDFNTGKFTSESEKAENFKDGVEFLSGQVRNVLDKFKPALGEAAIADFLKDLQDHANKKLKS